jgi:hypothetical protein
MPKAIGRAFCGFWLASTGAALADTPAPAQWILNNFQIYLQEEPYVTKSISPQTYDSPQAFALGASGPDESQAYILLDSYDTPQITLTSDVAATDFLADSSGDFELTYYAEINGPVGNVVIGVDAHGETQTAISGTATAAASAAIQINAFTGPPTTQNIIIANAYATNGNYDTFNLSQTFEQETNNVFEVFIFGATEADTNGGSAFAYANVDPYFYIPTSDPNYGDYSISVSSGIGNSPMSGVPEPSTWAMMLIGFAGLGFAGYRARKHAGAGLR